MSLFKKARTGIRFSIPLFLVLFALLLIGSPTAQGQDGEGDEPRPFPETVTIAGTFQPALGCNGDWQPPCEESMMEYNGVGDVWTAEFDIPAGEHRYKAAINGSWDLAYGVNADDTAGSPDIELDLDEDTTVNFVFDHKTGWIADDVNFIIANVAGSFQSEIGCPGDWQPECLRTWLQDIDGDGVYTYGANLPGGDWEAKVAINRSWDLAYGVDGDSTDGSPNYTLTVPDEGGFVSFNFDSETNLLTWEVGEPREMPEMEMADGGEGDDSGESAAPQQVEQPDTVSVPGTINSVIGCDGDWQPGCEAAQLELNEEYGVWINSFDLPMGEYEYKVAINGSWDENYGGRADQDGPNIPLVVEEDSTVTFVYSHATNWVMDDVNHVFANVAGSFQDEVGCSGDWQPECLITWLQDVDGDGLYEYTATGIPPGAYEAKVAVGQSWDLAYGEDGNSDPGSPNYSFVVPEGSTEVYFGFDSETNVLRISAEGAQRGSLALEQARWVAADTITWDLEVESLEDTTFMLHYSPYAELRLEFEGVSGGEMLELTVAEDGPGERVLEQFPHVEGHLTLRIAEEDLPMVREIVRGQVAVSAVSSEGRLLDATALQLPGVLDDLYLYDGDLGVTFDEAGVPTLRVWAPTARNVNLHVFDDSSAGTEPAVFEMERDDETGVWSVTGEANWYGKFYLYEVEVFVRTTGDIETNLVTDPYSFSLSMNSRHSQIIDLMDPELIPRGWNEYEKPALDAFEDIVLYELHIRDFSIFDETVPEDYRGTYMAFTVTDSNGMQHLTALADAGLTHIHLLPAFDIATINENKPRRFEPDYDELAALPADSDQQQAIIDPIRDLDGFNWGYDPYHYTVPEGSYSTQPDGATRILEFREMVMALNESGLRVVMDVVYNHTNSAGQTNRAVLDRIVPGYYHRLNDTGSVWTSTCCPNTATEHAMMEKLMVDSLVVWSTAYKVDGYRFDLMGHHMRDDMANVRQTLDALTVEEDGVDGSKIYVYGEGWDFGEVAGNARGVNATQLNIGGLGIGSFNDRLRDAARGGNPFGGWQDQGFVTGLYVDPNGITDGDEAEQEERLLLFQDQIRVGLAGNLRDYMFVSATGEEITGADIPYGSAPTGYTLDPQEHIIYVSAHDNETLFDAIQYKAPVETPMEERVRMQNIGMSLVMFSQGVPFFHAGTDMLRSKSLDRNSYNSGDWFNLLDFTYQTNNWGVGLPPAADNESNYSIMQPLLANPDLEPSPEHIEASVENFRELLRIRQSTSLFRLQTADDVMQRVNFHNTGPDQQRGLIVMSISDMVEALPDVDSGHELVVVLFNTSPNEVIFTEELVAGLGLELHPVQATSRDEVVQSAGFDSATGTFTVPGRTTAVFVLAE